MDAYTGSSNTTEYYRPGISDLTNVSEDHPKEPPSYTYDVHYRARMILSQPQNVLILGLGIIAIIMNVLSIFALSRISHSALTSRFRLILSLAISDALIGFSLIFFQLINAFVELYPPGFGPLQSRLVSRCLFCFSKALSTTGLAITLLNLLGMAIDHYIAIMHPLRYTVILSSQRCICMILAQWAIAVILGFSNFLSGLPKYHQPAIHERFNYCEFIHITKYQEEYTVFLLSLICLVSMMFIYIQIYLEVKRHQARTPQLSQEVVKNKKAIVTTLLILGTFILCWIPMAIYTVVLTVLVYVSPDVITEKLDVLVKVDSSLFILLLLNVITDPVIYAARAKEVQAGYKRLCCRDARARRYSSTSYDASTALVDLPRKSLRSPSAHAEKRTSEVMLSRLSERGCPVIRISQADALYVLEA